MGKLIRRDSKRRGDGTPTPARVVYLQADMTLCGVMTHVDETALGNGQGPFRVCDPE